MISNLVICVNIAHREREITTNRNKQKNPVAASSYHATQNETRTNEKNCLENLNKTQNNLHLIRVLEKCMCSSAHQTMVKIIISIWFYTRVILFIFFYFQQFAMKLTSFRRYELLNHVNLTVRLTTARTTTTTTAAVEAAASKTSLFQ